MEMVVVLAVIAILAAILTPIINSYVERARLNGARSDVKNIAAAIVQFNTDTKFWPIYVTKNDIPNGNVFRWMATDGADAAIPMFGTGSDWAGVSTNTTSLTTYLNTNFYTQSLNAGAGASAYRGPYLELSPDPWGSRYYVTAGNLMPGNANAAYVISAGPNQTIDTNYTQSKVSTFVTGGDDIVSRIK
jgi:type II secretory pathway pseudopilin PulG